MQRSTLSPAMETTQAKSDDLIYYGMLEQQKIEWEAACLHCGACCGVAEGDPCEHLVKSGENKYSCSIYDNRFGVHKTVKGRTFNCVPIRNILHESWAGDDCCGYKKKYLNKWLFWPINRMSTRQPFAIKTLENGFKIQKPQDILFVA